MDTMRFEWIDVHNFPSSISIQKQSENMFMKSKIRRKTDGCHDAKRKTNSYCTDYHVCLICGITLKVSFGDPVSSEKCCGEFNIFGIIWTGFLPERCAEINLLNAMKTYNNYFLSLTEINQEVLWAIQLARFIVVIMPFLNIKLNTTNNSKHR